MNVALEIVKIALGAIIAILFSIWIEWYRKPKLRLEIPDPQDRPHPPEFPFQHARFANLELVNDPPSHRLFRWLARNAATRCTGKASFHHLDGQDIFGRSMQIRWASSPQPKFTHVPNANPIPVYYPIAIDVHPGHAEGLGIVAHFDDEDECYGWNNDSWIHGGRNPNWKLPPGRYLVKVTIVSDGEKTSGLFRLINDVPQQDFRLGPALPKDYNAVKEVAEL